MYARDVADQTLNFGVSGKLWKGSLVMVDKETDSLWSHLLGQGIEGPMKGQVLETIPSVMTDWKSWKERYPETTIVIMTRTSEQYTRDFATKTKGLVIGLTLKDQSRVWKFADLKVQPIVNDRLGTKALLITYQRNSGTALIFDRLVQQKELTFEHRDDKLFDIETGTQWNMTTGIATNGRLKGKRLLRLAGLVSADVAFRDYHSNHTTWNPAEVSRTR